MQETLDALLSHVRSIAAKGPLAVYTQADRTLVGFAVGDACLFLSDGPHATQVLAYVSMHSMGGSRHV